VPCVLIDFVNELLEAAIIYRKNAKKSVINTWLACEKHVVVSVKNHRRQCEQRSKEGVLLADNADVAEGER
jgi:dsDNA-binding SOS-regulon protein